MTNLIQQQHQVRVSEKFVGTDTGKQLQRVINPIGLWIFLEVLRVKISISPDRRVFNRVPDRMH